MPDLHLESLTTVMQEPFGRYAKRLQELGGTNVLSLVAFGAVAAGSFDPRRHNARNVLVLQAVDLAMLKELAKDGAKLGKAGIAAPLVMTPEYITTSLDAFPLEFLEIQQRHLCIFGPDHFVDLPFEASHIRLQCEREVKTLLIGLRQALLTTGGNDKLLHRIETDAADRLMRTLRGFLWLHGHKDGLPALRVIEAVEAQSDRSLPGIRSALDEGQEQGWPEFQALYHDIDALRVLLDAW